MQTLPYIGPFAVFLAFLVLRFFLPLPAWGVQVLWAGITAAAIWLFSRSVLKTQRVRNWAGTVGVGVLVFLIWIGPDLLFPGYREHWLFSNAFLGQVTSGFPEEERANGLILILRMARAAVLVPILEELFWRGWLMRWLIKPDFEQVPMGAYAPQAFWIVAVLFASEHGTFWDVGLAAGILYNWWMIRTKSLGDLIVAHGITNLCLSFYVVATGHWEYWA